MPTKCECKCEYCKADYTGRKGSRFCSNRCSFRSRLPAPIKKVCEACNAEFVGRGKFCTRKCYSKNYRSTHDGKLVIENYKKSSACKLAHKRHREKARSKRAAYSKDYLAKYRKRPGVSEAYRAYAKKYQNSNKYVSRITGISIVEGELIELAKLSLSLKRILREKKK